MGALRRVGIEFAREASRPLWWRWAAVVLVLAALWSGTVLGDLDFFAYGLFLVAPLVAAPLAARAAVRDRETGLFAVLETTRLRAGETFVARACFTLVWVLLVHGALVVVALVVLQDAPPTARHHVLRFAAAGAAVGTVSAAVGLTIGAAALGRPVFATALSVSFAFLAVLLPIVPSFLFPFVPERLHDVALALVYLTPHMWVFEIMGWWEITGRLAFASAAPALGAAAFTVAGLLVAAVATLALQDADGWRRPRGRSVPATLAAVATIAVLLVWPHGALGVERRDVPDDSTDPAAPFGVRGALLPAGEPLEDLSAETPRFRLHGTGPEPALLLVLVGAEDGVLRHADSIAPVPWHGWGTGLTVEGTGVRREMGEVAPNVTATVFEVLVSAEHVRSLGGEPWVSVGVDVTVDGFQDTLDLTVDHEGVPLPWSMVLVTTLGPATGLMLLAEFLPRRANRA